MLWICFGVMLRADKPFLMDWWAFSVGSSEKSNGLFSIKQSSLSICGFSLIKILSPMTLRLSRV